VLDVDYTLTDPLVKVDQAIPYRVAGDFYVRNAVLLASPLSESLD